MTACIACGHPLRDHAAGGCTHPKGDYYGGICPCELTERIYTRAEVLAFGERVREAYIKWLDGGDHVRLAALLDGEGT